MNTTLGYKVERINVSALFKGFQKVHKIINDPYEQNVLWACVSKTSGGIQTNAVLKYNKETKATERMLDFGKNEVYSIHVSESYIAFLSSPKIQGTKRYLSFLNRSGGNTAVLTSLLYESAVIPAQEFGSVYEHNMMHFDGRFYWVLPKSPAQSIRKVDIVDLGASIGIDGINAPGGSCLTALTTELTNWCPDPLAVPDGKAYPFQGDLYFFPRGAGVFKINLLTEVSSAVSSPSYYAESGRMGFGLDQLQESGDYSEAGDTILFAVHEDATEESPVNHMGIMDMSSMEFTVFPMADYPGPAGALSRTASVEKDRIYFQIPSGAKTGIYFDCLEGMAYEYHLLGGDASVYAKAKAPGSFLDDSSILFIEEDGISAYRMNQTVPCRVVIHHILEDGSLYTPEEILLGAEGDSYGLLAKAVENKEVSSVVGQQSGVFTKADTVVDFHYSPIKIKTFIKVSAQDTEGAVLQEYTLEGFVGDSYSTTEMNISGYALETDAVNKTGTLAEINSPVVYVYRKLTAEEVYSGSSYLSVRYENGEGEEIKPSLYTVLPLGTSYTIPAPDITGHTLTSEATITGVCYDNTEYIVFRYTQNPVVGLARINYMAGTTIMMTSYVQGTAGTSTTYTPESIEGFTLPLTPFPVELKLVPEVYEIDCEPVVGLLLVHHRDVYDGKDIFPKEYFFSGLSAETETAVRAKIISNYGTTEQLADRAVFNPDENTWSAFMGTTLQNSLEGKIMEVEILYDTVNSSVKVLYRKDAEILLEKMLYGLNGSPYLTEPLDYDQYQIDVIEGTVNGTFGSRETTVSYLYKDRECQAHIEHLDKVTGQLITKTDYTQLYGTQLAVPFETFAGYTYVGTSLDSEPEQGMITFAREPVTVRFYHVRIDPTVMLKPLLGIRESSGTVEVDCRGAKTVVEGLRYRVEKRLNGGTWIPCLPVGKDSENLKTTYRILNLIEDDGMTMTYTPHLGTSQSIPQKAVLKSWLESEDNGMIVDYLDAREFELSPELYLRDQDGNLKYSVIVDGTYPDQASCILNEKGREAVEEWKASGLGYVDCSRRYKMTGRTPSVTTHKALLIEVMKGMRNTTGLDILETEVLDSPPINYVMQMDNVKYDKISNRIIVNVSAVDSGAGNPDAVYEFRVILVNCNDGSVHISSDPSPVSSINTSVPVSRCLFLVDDEASSYPPDENRTDMPVLYHPRQETLKYIDKYIHVVGEDIFGRRTALLNHRYYKEISVQDLASINSVISYAPKIVKENHRYRGPMESRKMNNFQTEVSLAIKEMTEILDGQASKLQEIKNLNNTEVYHLYIDMKDRSEL